MDSSFTTTIRKRLLSLSPSAPSLTLLLFLSISTVIPYYNIFDNKIFSASLGLDVKIGHFKIAGWTQTESARADIKGALPLPYAAAEVNLPFNFFIKGDVAGFGIKDYAIYDYEVAAGWKAIDTDIIDTAVEVGYRKFYLSGDDIEDLNVHAKADGFFAGVSINY